MPKQMTATKSDDVSKVRIYNHSANIIPGAQKSRHLIEISRTANSSKNRVNDYQDFSAGKGLSADLID